MRLGMDAAIGSRCVGCFLFKKPGEVSHARKPTGMPGLFDPQVGSGKDQACPLHLNAKDFFSDRSTQMGSKPHFEGVSGAVHMCEDRLGIDVFESARIELCFTQCNSMEMFSWSSAVLNPRQNHWCSQAYPRTP